MSRCAYCGKKVDSFPVNHYAMCVRCHKDITNYQSPVRVAVSIVVLSAIFIAFWFFVFFNSVFNWV